VTCSEASPQLTAYLDHELAGDERLLLEGHVASCAACTGLLGSLRKVSQELEALPPIELGAGFRRRVLARIEARRHEEPSKAAARPRVRPSSRKLGLPARWAWPTIGALGTLGAVAAAFLAIARGPIGPGDLANPSDLAIAGRLELFENYPSVQVVDAIDSPEDVAVVAELDRLGPAEPGEGAR
jgi:anti-sigma factor RsiW